MKTPLCCWCYVVVAAEIEADDVADAVDADDVAVGGVDGDVVEDDVGC